MQPTAFGFPQKPRGLQRPSASATVTSSQRAWPRRPRKGARPDPRVRAVPTDPSATEVGMSRDNPEPRTMPHRTTTKRTQTWSRTWRTPRDPPPATDVVRPLSLLSAIVDVRCRGRVATTTASRHVPRSTPEPNTTTPSPDEPCELIELEARDTRRPQPRSRSTDASHITDQPPHAHRALDTTTPRCCPH